MKRDDEQLGRWLEGDAQKGIPEKESAEWEEQSTIDTLLLMQEGKLSVSKDFHKDLMARANEDKSGRRVPQVLYWLGAAAACAIIGLSVWLSRPGDILIPGTGRRGADRPAAPPSTMAILAPGWQCESRGAKYQILSEERVRLEQGELYIKSVPIEEEGTERAPISIETDAGVATAKGTDFYVGKHSTEVNKEGNDMKNAVNSMRVLVLSGIVTLTNTFGTVSGEANDLLTADAKSAPVKETVKSNSEFAINLYKRIIKDKKHKDKNVFFSPFSVSSALAMTAEGARGKTAAEMADVLKFPKAARRQGDDPQLIPWRSSLIHTGFQQLNTMLDRESNNPSAQAIRQQIQELRVKLQEAKKATKAAKGNWKEHWKRVKAEEKIAGEIAKLSAQVDKFELNIANAVWAEKTYRIEKPFSDTIAKHYGTGAFRVADFINNYEAERKRINGWVEGKTKDRIKDLIPEGVLDKLTRLVLVNAIYFKGDWAIPFDEKKTKKADFTLTGGDRIKADTMHADILGAGSYAAFNSDGSFFSTPEKVPYRGDGGPARYPGKDGFAVAKLPYKGNELSMVLLAPMSHDGLGAIEKQLSSAKLGAWLGKLEQRKMNVALPKFRLETNYVLGKGGPKPTGILPEMGMARAFTEKPAPDGADFTGMHKPEELYIGLVLHKAFLDVNEKGTEAAAATAVIMNKKRGMPRTRPFVPTFRADRPFLLLIRHEATGAILFMGRVMNPAK